MNPVDIVILVMLAFGAFRGYQKGFLLEIVGIFALVLGIVGALMLLQTGMEFMSERFDISTQLLPYVTFLILFVLIIIGVNLIGRLVKSLLDLTLLGTADNFAGAVTGAIKWAIAISFLIWITSALGFNFFSDEDDKSQLFGYIEQLAPWIVDKAKVVAPYLKEIPEFKRA